VRDRSGAFHYPPEIKTAAALNEKNLHLQKSLDTLEANYACKVKECEEAYSQISFKLDRTIIKKEAKNEILVDNLKNEVNKLIIDNRKYKDKIEKQEEEIAELENRMKMRS